MMGLVKHRSAQYGFVIPTIISDKAVRKLGNRVFSNNYFLFGIFVILLIISFPTASMAADNGCDDFDIYTSAAHHFWVEWEADSDSDSRNIDWKAFEHDLDVGQKYMDDCLTPEHDTLVSYYQMTFDRFSGQGGMDDIDERLSSLQKERDAFSEIYKFGTSSFTYAMDKMTLINDFREGEMKLRSVESNAMLTPCRLPDKAPSLVSLNSWGISIPEKYSNGYSDVFEVTASIRYERVGKMALKSVMPAAASRDIENAYEDAIKKILRLSQFKDARRDCEPVEDSLNWNVTVNGDNLRWTLANGHLP